MIQTELDKIKAVIARLRETYDEYKNDDSYNNIGKLNLVAYIGERSGILFAEIERLEAELERLRAELETLTAAYRRLEETCDHLSDEVQRRRAIDAGVGE